nr:bifunctional metallophosphatase/5'-nucleotidase [Burkholderiaceae bacterium]
MALPRDRRIGAWAGWLVAIGLLAACAPQRAVQEFSQAPARADPSAPVQVTVLAFTDFHGNLLPQESGTLDLPDPAGDVDRGVDAAPGAALGPAVPRRGPVRRVAVGGAAYLAALIQQRRALNPNTLVLSAGDLIGASRLSSALFRDEPTIEAMNLIGLDANVVGNHEFDKGRDELDRQVKGGCAAGAVQGAENSTLASCAGPQGNYLGARFTFLAANVLDATGRPIHPAYLIRQFGAVKVGVIGVATRTTPTIVSPNGVAGLRFADEAATVNRAVAELRAQGIEAIVVVMHEGGQASQRNGPGERCVNARGEGFQIVDKLDRTVDLVIAGHTHQAYNCVHNGIRVVQAGSFGRLLAQIDLSIDPLSRDVVPGSVAARQWPVVNSLNADAATLAAYPPLKPDPTVASLVAHYAALAAPRIEREVGRLAGAFNRNPSPGGDHAAGRLVADAYLAATAGAGQGQATIALVNPGGVRSNLIATGPEGAVSYGAVFQLQPFGNSLVTMSLTGAQLKALLEQQWTGANATEARVLRPSS